MQLLWLNGNGKFLLFFDYCIAYGVQNNLFNIFHF